MDVSMRTRQPSAKDLSPDLPIYKLSDQDFGSQSTSNFFWIPVPSVDGEVRGQTGLKADVAACFHAPFIEFGYRTNYTLWETFISVFAFHNESTNIWTHLIGFICVSLVGVHILVDYHLENGHNGKEIGLYGTIIFETYITCAAICLGLSSAYHWFGCYSVDCHKTLLRLDLTGVGLLVAGSFYPAIYYGFYCQPELQAAYLVLSTFVLIIGLIAPWIETKVNGVHVRPYIFAALVTLGLIPCSHWAVVTPREYKDNLQMGFFLLFFWYGLGFFFFVSKLPERLFPKSVIATMVVPSHTMWHICVLGAIYVWFYHIIQYQKMLGSIGCVPYNL